MLATTLLFLIWPWTLPALFFIRTTLFYSLDDHNRCLRFRDEKYSKVKKKGVFEVLDRLSHSAAYKLRHCRGKQSWPVPVFSSYARNRGPHGIKPTREKTRFSVRKSLGFRVDCVGEIEDFTRRLQV